MFGLLRELYLFSHALFDLICLKGFWLTRKKKKREKKNTIVLQTAKIRGIRSAWGPVEEKISGSPTWTPAAEDGTHCEKGSCGLVALLMTILKREVRPTQPPRYAVVVMVSLWAAVTRGLGPPSLQMVGLWAAVRRGLRPTIKF